MQKIYTFICSNLLAAVEKRKEAEAQAWEGVTAWEQKAFLFWRCNKQPSRVIGQTQTRLFLAHPRCSPCLSKYENTCDKNLFRTKKDQNKILLNITWEIVCFFKSFINMQWKWQSKLHTFCYCLITSCAWIAWEMFSTLLMKSFINVAHANELDFYHIWPIICLFHGSEM